MLNLIAAKNSSFTVYCTGIHERIENHNPLGCEHGQVGIWDEWMGGCLEMGQLTCLLMMELSMTQGSPLSWRGVSWEGS